MSEKAPRTPTNERPPFKDVIVAGKGFAPESDVSSQSDEEYKEAFETASLNRELDDEEHRLNEELDEEFTKRRFEAIKAHPNDIENQMALLDAEQEATRAELNAQYAADRNELNGGTGNADVVESSEPTAEADPAKNGKPLAVEGGDLQAIIDDARIKLEAQKAKALSEAYDEYEKQEGTPYDVDKGRVKDSDEAQDLAYGEDFSRSLKKNPGALKNPAVIKQMQELQAALNGTETQPVAEAEAQREASDKEIKDLEEALKNPAGAKPEGGDDAQDLKKNDLEALQEALKNPAGARPEEGGDAPSLEKNDLRALQEALKNPAGAKPEEDQGSDGTPSLEKNDLRALQEAFKSSGEQQETSDDKVEKKGKKKKRFSLARKAYARAGAFFANKQFGLMERLPASDRKKYKVVLGAVVLTAATLATLKLTGVGIDHEGGGTGGGSGGGWTPEADGNDHASMDPERFTDAARKVKDDEGWFETMADAGITDPEKQRAILANSEVMGKLEEMGLAYRAPELGGYGISMPEDGKMPVEALELLTNAAK